MRVLRTREGPALGFEEPKAHLHPHATRALVARLLESELPAILTTHSAAVTDAADHTDHRAPPSQEDGIPQQCAQYRPER